MSNEERMKRVLEINRAFTPSAPVDELDLFAGRLKQVQQVMTGVGQKGLHVVIYGERGVGKTSLANVLKFFLGGVNETVVVKVNCDGSSTPSSLWRSVFREIPVVAKRTRMGFSPNTEDELVDLSPDVQEAVSPDDVRFLLQKLTISPVIIFDELDRIKGKKTLAAISDTIKSLSDHAVSATLILVGVGDSVDSLVAEHKSVERAIIQVKMPRMSKEESKEIVQKALSKIRMNIGADALEKIGSLAQGLPHYAHLLGLHAATAAVFADSDSISNAHVRTAIKEAVNNAQQTIKTGYHNAVSSPRGNLYPQVLLACAIANVDELAFFTSVNVREPMTRVMKKPYEIAAYSRHLNDFCTEDRGPILEKVGFRRRYRYRFINPLMQPYIIMKGLSDGMITEELWDFS